MLHNPLKFLPQPINNKDWQRPSTKRGSQGRKDHVQWGGWGGWTLGCGVLVPLGMGNRKYLGKLSE